MKNPLSKEQTIKRVLKIFERVSGQSLDTYQKGKRNFSSISGNDNSNTISNDDIKNDKQDIKTLISNII